VSGSFGTGPQASLNSSIPRIGENQPKKGRRSQFSTSIIDSRTKEEQSLPLAKRGVHLYQHSKGQSKLLMAMGTR